MDNYIIRELMDRSSSARVLNLYKEYYKLIDLTIRAFRELNTLDITDKVVRDMRNFCKKEISSIENVLHQGLSNKEYGTLTDTMLKLNRQLKDIKYKENIQQKLLKQNLQNVEPENNTYFKIKQQLLSHLNSGKLIPTSESNRNIGKTTALIEISREYNIPIIMQTSIKAKEFSSLNSGVEIYTIKRLEDLRGKRFDNGVLIDEGLSFGDIKLIKDMGIKIRTGFFYSPYFI